MNRDSHVGWQLLRAAGGLALLLLAALPSSPGATATWTNLADGSVGYWTNAPNWNNAAYPGIVAGDSAFLTNATSSSYTAILNRTLPLFGTMVISNSGGGSARLVVANGGATNFALRLGTGGRLQVDAGGFLYLTNELSFSGSGGSLVLNDGGTVLTSISGGSWYFGSVNGVTGLVTRTSAAGGTLNFGGNSMFVGSGTAATNSVLAISGVTLTNVGNFRVGSGAATAGGSPAVGNSLVFSNGATVVAPSAAFSLGLLTNDNNNSALFGGEGAASTISVGGLTIGSGGTTLGNSVVVTNAYVVLNGSSSAVGGGSSSSNNMLFVRSGGVLNLAGNILRVGSGSGSANNQMTVEGGAVSNVTTLSVGYNSGNVGARVRVVSGLLQVTNLLEVGVNSGASGLMDVEGGAVLAKTLNIAGTGNASTGTVTVSGGLLNIAGTLIVGSGGSSLGNLVVHGGAVSNVNTSQGNLVGQNGGTGNILVDGGSVVFTNGIYLGGNGSLGFGTLTVTGGSFSMVNPGGSGGNGYFMVANGSVGSVGRVVVGGSGSLLVLAGNGSGFLVGGNTGTTGSVLVAGGSATLANPGGSLQFASGLGSLGSLVVSNGTLVISNGVTMAGGRGSVGVFGQYGGTSTLSSSFTLAGGIGATGTFTMAGGQLNLGGNLVATNSFSGSTQSLVTVSFAGGTVGAVGNWTLFGNSRLTNAFGGSGTVTFAPTNAAHTITLAGVVSGDGALVKDGAGALALMSNNTYTGGTVVSNGVVVVGANQAFGTGPAAKFLSGTTLVASNSSPDALLAGLDVSSSAPSVFALGAGTTNNLNFTVAGLSNTFFGAYGGGTVWYAGALTPQGTTYQLGGGGGTLLFSNQLAGASNVVIGVLGNPNTGMVLLAASNAFSGGVTLNSGALGFGTGSTNTSQIINGMGSGTLTVNGGFLNMGSVQGNTVYFSNAIVLNTNLSVYTYNANRYLMASISGEGGVFFTNSPGTLYFNGGNTYAGDTVVSNSGVGLVAGASNMFGSGTVRFQAGTVVRGSGSFTNRLNIEGPLQLVAGLNTSGPVDLYGGEQVISNAPATSYAQYFYGAISNGGLTLVNGSAYGYSGFVFGGSNTYLGVTRVQAQPLQLLPGGFLNSTNVYVYNGGSLTLSYTNFPASRIAAGSVVTLTNGFLNLLGGGAALAYTQQIDTVVFGGGANVLQVTNRATLSALNVLRGAAATLTIVGTNAPTIPVANAPDGTVNGVVPWITLGGSNFAAYSGGAIVALANYVSAFTNDATANVRLAAPAPLGIGSASINTLAVPAGGGLIDLSNETLTVAAGGLLLGASGQGFTNGTVSFGSADGTLWANAGTVTNFAAMTGNGGFAKAGAGNLVLYGSQSFAGGFSIQQSNVTLASGASLSVGGELWVATTNGAGFTLNGGSATLGGLNVSSNGALNGAGTLVLNSGTLTTTGNVTLSAAANLGANGAVTWNMSGGSNVVASGIVVGSASGAQNSRLVISNGAVVSSALGTVSGNGGNNNSALVSDPGTVWNSGTLTIGAGAVFGNQLMVSNGAAVVSTSTAAMLGGWGNSILVTGSNSLWSDAGSTLRLFYASGNTSSVQVLDGGRIVSAASEIRLGESSAASNHLFLVAGPGSTLMATNTSGASGLWIGYQAGSQATSLGLRFLVTNGGSVFVSNAFLNGSSSNFVLVSDPGSVWSNYASFYVGRYANSTGNALVVSNQGVFSSANLYLAVGSTGVSNINNASATVTGPGSILASPVLQVGSAINSNYGGVYVFNGGTLEANSLTVASNQIGGMAGVITNNGGIYQFTVAGPTIAVQTNARGLVSLVNGTISFRNATGVNVRANISGTQLTNILFAGQNTFRLNNASVSNAAQAYVFDNTLGPTNYAALEMVHGATLWQGGSLTISNGGTMLASNSAATIAAAVTNLGAITVAGGSATWSNSVLLAAGSFLARGGTNAFLGGGTLAPGASLLADGAAPVSFGGGAFANRGSAVFSNLATVLAGGTWLASTNLGTNAFVGGLRNQGTLAINSNAAVYVGGMDAASALGSSVTLTNASGGTIVLASGGLVSGGAMAGVLYASTNGIGVVNQGMIQNSTADHYTTGFVNAAVYNDVGGTIGQAGGSRINLLTIQRVPTNAGTIQIVNGSTTILISEGDLVNRGTVQTLVERASISVRNGAFINDTNGTLLLSANNNTAPVAVSTWNLGTITVSNYNVGGGYSASFGQGVTNDGLIRLYTAPNAVANNDTIGGTNLINRGTVAAIGLYDGLTTSFRLTRIGNGASGFGAMAVTNLPGGLIYATNGSALAINGFFRNDGTLAVYGNSTLGVGSVDSVGSVLVGTLPFSNPGAISLAGGTFAAAFLTNTGTLQGYGSMGRVHLTNLVLGAASNMVRNFAANNAILNTGSLLPAGTLNAGAISNLAGGLISGYGTITSSSATNYYDAATNLVTLVTPTGAQVYNASNATILASGGTLILDNGFAGGTQYGLVGATNGGVLQLGNGTLGFTNYGTIRVYSGGLAFGQVVSAGSVGLQNGVGNYSSLYTIGSGGSYLSEGSTNNFNGGLIVSAGGTLGVSNGNSAFSGALTSSGSVRVVNANVTYGGPVVVGGLYASDPSTNVFTSNVTVTASGALSGGAGDLFVFQDNLVLMSTNRSEYDLSLSSMRFTNGGGSTNHLLNLDGSGAVDMGANWTIPGLSTNFSLGSLAISLGNTLHLTGGVGNAFYVGVLDLGGLGTNDLAAVLDLDANLYYDPNAIGNEYLNGLAYDFAEWNGSLTPLGLPIPEPSPLLAVGAGLALLAALRRRRAS